MVLTVRSRLFLRFIISLVFANWLYAILYKSIWKGKPALYWRKSDKRMGQILRACPSLHDRYFPTFWAHGNNIQMLIMTIYHFLHRNKVQYKQHILQTPDKGEVRIDEFIAPPGEELPASAPICVFLHTITGDAASCSEFATEVFSKGWRPFVFLRRGHFGPLRSPKFNIMGDVSDTRLMINRVLELYPKAKFVGAIGISAGSGQLVTYIGQQGKSFPIHAAVSLCPGYSVRTAFETLHKEQPLLTKYLLRGLKKKFLIDNEKLLSSQKGYTEALQSKSVHEFIVKSSSLAGFESFEEYLKHSDPMEHFRGNKIPCLILNSRDDPICLAKNIQLDLADKISNYALVLTNYGSHIAYREGLLGNKSWMYRVSMEFLQAALTLHSHDEE